MVRILNPRQLKVFGCVAAVLIPVCSIISFSTVLQEFVFGHDDDEGALPKGVPPHFQRRDLFTIDPAEVPLAWLMAFPRSGQSFVMDLVQHMTNTSVATNYGTVQINLDGSVEAVSETSARTYDTRGNGPFMYGKGLCQPEQGYMLTRTHCGGFCTNCRPMGYIKKPKVFKYECASGLMHEQRSGKTYSTLYDFDLAKKALHMFRDPFDVVVSRFFHTWRKCKDDNDVEFVHKYEQSPAGFRKWCFERDTDPHLLEQEQRWYNPPDYKAALNVRCHAEFYKYVQWHNLTFDTTDRFDLPTQILHYEDFVHDYQGTTDNILNFLELAPLVINPKPEFNFQGHYANDYFTHEERLAVTVFVHTMASNRTWAQTKRYMHGLDELRWLGIH